MIIVPSLVAYVLGLLFSLDITIVRDTFGILLASVAYGLVIAVSAGLLMLALSSLSRNSRYVALFWMGIWIRHQHGVAGFSMKVEQEQRHAPGRRRIAQLGKRRVLDRGDRSGQDRLAAARFVHGEPAPRRRAIAAARTRAWERLEPVVAGRPARASSCCR